MLSSSFVAFNSSVSGIDFFLKKTEFTFSVFSVCSLNESPDFRASRKSNAVENQYVVNYTIEW